MKYVYLCNRAERYRAEREELKAALSRAEAAAAEAQQRLQRQQHRAASSSSVPPRTPLRTGMAALVPSGSQMALAAGNSAEKRITINGRDGRTGDQEPRVLEKRL